ncbi:MULTISPECIES: VOC family protein [unclassified Chelatococcus]|uniref:VOC family protein n=1 Tax=unclassified Chelatococcus TaxID=2638111 RepID=UPI001BCB5B4B|nr:MULTISPECIES: VOC family protein [unclassified Chelatococcus]MBS7697463.1 VOC family protein [Chelatococcus sp. YT9]MBX3560027.1 VOC family protein [Chelatococcus sp.]
MTGTVSGISHVGLAVPDVDAAAAHWERVLGIAAGPVFENETQGVRLRRIDLGAVYIELLQPLQADSPLAGYLQKSPRGGLHHLAFSTANLDDTLAGMASGGAELLGQPSLNVMGVRMAFLKPSAMQGVLVEVEESG